MPNYDVLNTTTGEVTEMFKTIANMEIFLKENPEYQITFLSCQVGDPVALGVKKCPSDFIRGVIEPIHRRNHSLRPVSDLKYRAPREI